MKRLLFINRFFSPDHSATSQLLSEVCFYLAAEGFEVEVITSRQLYEDAGATLPAIERVRGVKVTRLWSSRFGRQRLHLRALDYITFYLAALWFCVIHLTRNDVIVAKTDPPLISVIVWLAARIRGAVLVNWIQDLYPEVALAMGATSITPFSGLLKFFANRSLRGAATNIAIGELMAQRLASKGVDAHKIVVQPNWADGADIHPRPHTQNSLREEWGLNEKFVVGYSGNMGRVHEFTTIVGAIKRLQAHPEVCFLFIGGGAQRNWIELQLNAEERANVLFKPYQPQSRLVESLGVPDVHLVSLRPEFEGLIVPSKFYGIAAAGRPTIYIGAKEGEVPRLLNEHACGVTILPGDVEGLVQIILRCKSDKTLVGEMARQARICFSERFDKPIALSAWRHLALKLCAP